MPHNEDLLTRAVRTERTTKDEGPATFGLAYIDQLEELLLVNDVYQGTYHMRRRGEMYLPKFPREDDGVYATRLKQAVLFNALKRTVQGLTGMVFRKDIVLGQDVPTEISGTEGQPGLWEDIDGAGRHGDVFCKDVFESSMRDGHSHILVDFTSIEGAENLTLGQERARGARPYWSHIYKGDLTGFRFVDKEGVPILTQIRIRETTAEHTGEFGEEEVERYRVFTLGDFEIPDPTQTPQEREEQEEIRTIVLPNRVLWSLWQKDKKTGAQTGARQDSGWTVLQEGFLPERFDFIPVSTVYSQRAGFMVSRPPLIDLAHENVQHYQLRSDRFNNLHLTGNPFPAFIGLEDEGDLRVGGGWGIKLPMGGDAHFVETEGNALQHTAEELDKIEQHMMTLGLQMLQKDQRAAETAESKRVDKAERDSQLGMAARNLGDGIEEALAATAVWLGRDRDSGGSVEVNRDFGIEPLPPQLVKELAALVPNKLSIDTLWDILIQGEILPDTFDPELERERIEDAEGATLDTLQALAGRGNGGVPSPAGGEDDE